MEIKFTEIAEFLGMKDVKSFDDFKENFEKDFLRVSTLTGKEDALKPIFGKVIGGWETKLKSIAKKHNAEWAKEMPGELSDKLEFAFGRIIEDNQKTIEELKKSAGQGNDEKVKEWEEKYNKLSSKYNDTEGLLKNTKTDFENFKAQKESEFKNIKLSTIKDEALKKIKFKSGITEVEKRGFEAIVREKYKIDMDDKGEAFVADKDGNRIKNPKVSGTFKSIDDILAEEAIAAKLIEMNPHAKGTPAQPAGEPARVAPPAIKPRYVHPHAAV